MLPRRKCPPAGELLPPTPAQIARTAIGKIQGLPRVQRHPTISAKSKRDASRDAGRGSVRSAFPLLCSPWRSGQSVGAVWLPPVGVVAGLSRLSAYVLHRFSGIPDDAASAGSANFGTHPMPVHWDRTGVAPPSQPTPRNRVGWTAARPRGPLDDGTKAERASRQPASYFISPALPTPGSRASVRESRGMASCKMGDPATAEDRPG